MPSMHPRSQRGKLAISWQQYGRSVLGAPLLWFPANQTDSNSGLILAGTHGDENAAIATLSAALRTLPDGLRRHHVVLAVNPDGCQLGLRANANGVDLNRNFPAANWQSGETVYRWNSAADARDVTLSTGAHPASEPETQALCSLIHQLKPAWWFPGMSRWPVSTIRITPRSVPGWPRRRVCRASAAWAMPRPAPLAVGVTT